MIWLWLALANATTWSVPGDYESLKLAVENAQFGDTIEVDQAYNRRGAIVEIANSLTIKGVGGQPLLEGIAVLLGDVTIENAQLRGYNVNGGDITFDDRAVLAVGGSVTIMDSVLLPSDADGAGVLAQGADVTLIRTTAEAFTSPLGVVSVTLGHLDVQQSQFTENFGTLNVAQGSATISGSTFSANYGLAGADLVVGNIIAETITISDSTFNGSVSETGGSIFGSAINLELMDSTWSGGWANDSGGAVTVLGTPDAPSGLFVDNCNFMGLSAGTGGAFAMTNVDQGVIQNSTFDTNYAWDNGGAIALAGGGLVLQDNVFLANQTAGYGGSVLTSTSTDSSSTPAHLDFLRNSVTGVPDGLDASDGAGLAFTGSSTGAVLESDFSTLNAAFDGGGILHQGSFLDVASSSFLANESSWGAGITAYSNMTVRDSTFQGNAAEVSGGGISGYGASLTVEDNLFHKNHAVKFGSAVDLQDGHGIKLIRNRICQNTAGGSKGIVALSSKNGDEWSVQNNVFLENASESGASLFYSEDWFEQPKVLVRNNNFIRDGGGGALRISYGTVDVRNNIFKGNPLGIQADTPGWSGLTSGYNLWLNNEEYGSNVLPDASSLDDMDPLFIQDTPGDCSSIYWVDPTSPVRDAGDPDIFDTDGSRSDIGAYGGPYGLMLDDDGDGVPHPADCDDTDNTIYPGAEEVPYDGIDQDCDGTDECDADGDGFLAQQCGGDDCRDGNAKVHPGRADRMNDGLDNDCDGVESRTFFVGGGGCNQSGTAPWFSLLMLPLLARRKRPIR